MRQKPFIYLSEHLRDNKTVTWYGIFAIRLVSSPVELRGEKDIRKSILNHLYNHIDFINSLFSPTPPKSFTIRYITSPNPADFASGRIDVILFGRLTGNDSKTATNRQALQLFQEVAALLGGSFPDFEWSSIIDSTSFFDIWQPFDIDKAYIAEIRRREDIINLKTLPPRPALGKGRSETQKFKYSDNTIYTIYRFSPQTNSLSRLLRTLLLHPSQILLQISIEPVPLKKYEEDAFIEQISKCEKYIHSIRSKGIEPPRDQTIHLNRARYVYEKLTEQLIRLQDAPYILQISLASPDPLPRILVEAAGVEITEPVGGKSTPSSGSNSYYLMGGYDVLYPEGSEEENVARRNLKYAIFEHWGKNIGPENLFRLRYLVDATEAVAAFRFPFSDKEGLPGLQTRIMKYHPLPREIADLADLKSSSDSLLLGVHTYLGFEHNVYISEGDRKQHMYVVGQTGTGKTTLLKTMIIGDIIAGKGVAVIDPHGDLYSELLNFIPENRRDDVVLFDPTDVEYPVGLNLMECITDEERYFVVREMRSIIERLLYDQYERESVAFAGPIFYQHMQMNMLLSMSDSTNPGTLIEFYEIFKHSDYWKKWLPLKWDDPLLKNWTESTLPNTDYTRRYSEGSSYGEYLSSKFDDFVFDPVLRYVFGQKRSTLKIREIMDTGKILLVNLAKGKLSEPNARFLGMILMAKIQSAAMERVSISSRERKIFNLYVDEFQSIATQNFLLLLSEARKFGLNLILANQFISQIKDQRIIQSIFGNVGSIISFRVGQNDAIDLEPHFMPSYDRYAFSNLPNWHAIIKTTVGGQTVTPFMIKTCLPERSEMFGQVEDIRNRSRKLYAKPRHVVEEEIAKSLKMTSLNIT